MTTTTRDAAVLDPVCVATTGHQFATRTLHDDDGRETKAWPDEQIVQPRSKAFRAAQFSADGTTIVTQHQDQCLRTFVLPNGLLSDSGQPHSLDPYCSLPSATPIQSYALYPKFNLQDPATTVVAYAARDLPIRLVNVLYPDAVHAQYPLFNPITEEYLAPSCLTWTRDGRRFLAGSKNLISVFNASYDGSGPILQHKLAHMEKAQRRYGAQDTCRGIVSALSLSADGVLAVGTLERNLALFTNEGAGECTTCLNLSPLKDRHDQAKGDGITHLAWSPCSTYLLIAERQSDYIQVYDVRNTFERVACLTGRNASTLQRLGVDVAPVAEGFEVWAGGKDGVARMWKNPGSFQGEQAPSLALDLHEHPISGAVWHPTGAVLATCTGRDFKDGRFIDADSNDRASHVSMDEPDNMLKIWTV